MQFLPSLKALGFLALIIMNAPIPLLTYLDIIERLRNYAGQQELFKHSNERVSKELKELADTIEARQPYMKGRIE